MRFLPIFFFFNDTATTELYTLSLHDALPISNSLLLQIGDLRILLDCGLNPKLTGRRGERSEEHTSELQSHSDLVCRLLLEKKNNAYSCYRGHAADLVSAQLHRCPVLHYQLMT